MSDMAEWSGGLWAQVEIGKRLEGETLSDEDRALAAEALEQLALGNWRVKPSSDGVLAMMFGPLDEIVVSLLDDWHWLVVVLTTPTLATSDHPIIMLGEPAPNSPASNVGPASALEIWLPVDSRHAVVLSRERLVTPILGLSNGHVRAINARLALESHRWVFYRPGTDPLRGLQVPRLSPKFEAVTLGVRDRADGTVGELVRVGVERPRVAGERLLSGRTLRPFDR